MADSFSERWRSEEGGALAAAVLERLAQGGALVGLGLGMTDDGRFDLRGFQAEGRVKLTGAVLKSVDLSGATLDGLWLTASEVSECVFDGARWRDGRVWGCTFDSCSFREADLRDLGVAPEHEGRRSLFRRCAFARTALRGFTCPGAVFEDCRFEESRLSKIDFGGSIFRRTTFAGRLSDVIFHDVPWDHEHFEPNEMQDVDFREAELLFVEFRSLVMRQVRWPDHPANETFAHYPCVLARTVEAYEADPRADARGIGGGFRQRLDWMHPDRETGVVHRGELEGLEDETIELMRRVERECAEAPDRGPRGRRDLLARVWPRKHR